MSEKKVITVYGTSGAGTSSLAILMREDHEALKQYEVQVHNDAAALKKCDIAIWAYRRGYANESAVEKLQALTVPVLLAITGNEMDDNALWWHSHRAALCEICPFVRDGLGVTLADVNLCPEPLRPILLLQKQLSREALWYHVRQLV